MPFQYLEQGLGAGTVVIEGIHAKMKRAEMVRATERRQLEDRVHDLTRTKEQLERELYASQQQLDKAAKEITALQEALDMDAALKAREALRIGPGLASSPMWSTVSFAMVKKERERRLAETDVSEAKRKQQEQRHQREYEVQEQKHLEDLQRMERARQSDFDEIERLRKIVEGLQLNDGAVPLLGEQQKVVEVAWEAARREIEEGGEPIEEETFELSSWGFDEFLETLDLHKIVAVAFERLVADPRCPAVLQYGAGRRAFLRALGSQGGRSTSDAILRSSPLLQGLTDVVWRGMQRVADDATRIDAGRQAVATEKAAMAAMAGSVYDIDWLNRDQCLEKLEALSRVPSFGPAALVGIETVFSAERGSNNVSFKGGSSFIEGSEAKGGSPRNERCGPSVDGLAAIMREHCVAADSDHRFLAPKVGIETTSRLEWCLVADPPAALELLGLKQWHNGGTPPRLGSRPVTSLNSNIFKQGLAEVKERLAAVGDGSGLSLEAFCALRLYTGPLALKYTAAVRVTRDDRWRFQSPVLESYMDDVCFGNTYSTTVHHLSLALSKLAKLSKAPRVYRAVASSLPSTFFDDDSEPGGIVGAVDLGLSTATTCKEQAMSNAAALGRAVVLEIQQGSAGRGVSFGEGSGLGWLRQLPCEESNVLLEPLLTCQVHRTRVEGGFVIVELRPSASKAVELEELQLNADVLQSEVLRAAQQSFVEGQPFLTQVAPPDIDPEKEEDARVPWEKRMLARVKVHQAQQALIAQAAMMAAKAADNEQEDFGRVQTSGSGTEKLRIQAAMDRAQLRGHRSREGATRISRHLQMTAREAEVLEGWGRLDYHEELRWSLSDLAHEKRE